MNGYLGFDDERYELATPDGTPIHMTGTIKDGLALDDNTGSWYLSSGTVYGGTLSQSGSAQFIATFVHPYGGLLDGVTVEADLDLSQIQAANMRVTNSVINRAGSPGSVHSGRASPMTSSSFCASACDMKS